MLAPGSNVNQAVRGRMQIRPHTAPSCYSTALRKTNNKTGFTLSNAWRTWNVRGSTSFSRLSLPHVSTTPARTVRKYLELLR